MGIRTYRGQLVVDKRWPDGTRITRRVANRTQAKELLARIDASIAEGNWPEFRDRLRLRDRGKITLRDFSRTYVEDYAKARNKTQSWKRKEVSLRALNRYLGRLDLDAIMPTQLHSYVKNRKAEGVKDATINRDLTVVKHLLNYAVECRLLESNPVERFKNLREEQNERPRFTDEEVYEVIDRTSPICRPVFVFILETGCRREEAMSLRHWQVQEDSRLVVFSEDTKSRRFRYVPLTDTAIEAVNALPLLDECPYVFYNPKTGDRWKYCRRQWENARTAAGYPEMQVKDLRRHYAIKLAEGGADMHDIQQVLGHSSVATTERYYAQFSPEHSARKILKVLEGSRSGAETKRKHRFSRQAAAE